MRRIAAILAVTVMVAGSALAAAWPAAASHRTTRAVPRYFYLSLGDSLAQGIQPNATGTDVKTREGYPDQLFTALRLGNPLLHLVKLGCPGETTKTMIHGGICTYKGGSQLALASRFLKNHPGHVQLVTIDIGANDLNPCVALSSIIKIVKCLQKVIPRTLKNLATIMGTLRAASPVPVRIIGMNYYDPELAYWLRGTSAGRTLARDSVTLVDAFNKDLTSVYTAFKAPVANVFTPFHSTDLKHKVLLPAFGKVPRDVAYICSYTWECTPFQNEHANRLGYAVIANAFLTKILG